MLYEDRWNFSDNVLELERFLRDVESKYYFLTDRELDKKALEYFMTQSSYKFYDQLSKAGFLHLASIAVSPNHQYKGIGKSLVNWGLDVAANEEIPVTLESSMRGRRMYTSLGFVVIEQSVMWDEFDGIAMLWEPPALKRRWLEADDEGNARLKTVDLPGN